MGLYGGIVPHLPAHGEQHVWNIVGYMGTVVMQHGGVPPGHVRIISLGGGTDVAERSTVVLLCFMVILNGSSLVLFGPAPTPLMVASNLATLFLFGVICPFCCTACG